MKKFILALMIALLPTVALADKAPKTPESKVYDFEITRVIDGDTVEFKADFLPAPLKPVLSIRVYGGDTPEKSWRGQCDKEKKMGEEASKFTAKLIKDAKMIQVAIMEWDKFGGRVLGDIIIDGKSLTKMLIEKGYAREYYGDKKQSWCN